ncbi:PriCT-2 domain-containing protein [Endozoicomonas sp. SM1973]|uniref:PriCT-2 domain-containing protein n=1 Tax=Spartinivicinus marinus TaxID=2994442 RepID=A0A853IPF2_9GAMM|nr:PriCT-2 domain-containing protein [Spartinivicinus marinus]MCX4025191.1 PriCT-2 domain-containing protein [Spartinivicinus marinus]MCX4027870.1 PriCT-2 domain-containing protein [Spartinivicinus marinus]NYZ69776.1 PriCT-2 domain-containing protein [Spartinivicinus marinus]
MQFTLLPASHEAKGCLCSENSWPDFYKHYLSNHQVRPLKEGPLFCPTIFKDNHRCLANAISAQFIVFDYDNKIGKERSNSPALPDDVAFELEGYAWACYSTYSHQDDWPKWRLVIPLDRPIKPFEWEAVWTGAFYTLGGDSNNIDTSCKDMSRAFWLPACHPERKDQVFTEFYEGTFISVEKLIEASGLIPKAPEPEAPTIPKNRASTLPLATLRDVCDALQYIDPTPYEDWVKVGMALYNLNNDETGFSLWQQWSSQASNYDAKAIKEMPAKWKSFGNRPNEIQLETLFYRAKESGWPGNQQPVKSNLVDNLLKKQQEQLTIPDEKIFKQEHHQPQFPSHLLTVGGMLGLVSDLINRTATKVQPVFSLCAAIMLVGLLTNRKFCTPTGLRLNEYIVCLGPTGSGKDHPRKALKKILHDLQLTDYLGGERVASGQGLLSRVKNNPNVLFPIDEMGLLLQSVMHTNASNHEAQIITNLMQLYTSAASIFIGTEYADQKNKPRQDIEYPHVFLYGSSATEEFWRALESKNVLSGFVSRMLITQTSDEYPADNEFQQIDIKAPEELKEWWKEVSNLSGDDGNLVGLSPDKPIRLLFDKPAKELVDHYNRDIIHSALKQGNEVDRALFSRAFEHVSKLASIRALSNNPKSRYIQLDDVKWAMDFVSYSINVTRFAAQNRMADSEYQKNYNEILEAFRCAGNKGITEREFNRGVFSKWSKKVRMEIRDTLIAAELIKYGRVEGIAGRPRHAFVAMQAE